MTILRNTSGFGFLLLLSIVIFPTPFVSAQNQCLSQNEVAKVIGSIKNPVRSKKNNKLRRELLKMQEERTSLNRRLFQNPKDVKSLALKSENVGRKQLLRLCQIFKTHGWLTRKTVKKDGVEAALFVIRNAEDIVIQNTLFPILVEATQKGLISKGNLAALIDKRRIKNRGKQIFGTQIKIRNEIGYLYPLENNLKVDQWRKTYQLPPISEFIKLIEIRYRTIVVRMPQPPTLVARKKTDAVSKDDKLISSLSNNEDEIISVESGLVNLNLRILNKDLNETRGLDLTKEDFLVYENGIKQDISFFSATDKPFDLVLLLDLSGSTRQKQYLVVESALQFIELARPKDRIAVVTFTNRAKIISNLSGDKKKLKEKVKLINDFGGSRVWDALDYTYKKVLTTSKKGRRSAVVFMTDGVDNSLMQNRTPILSVGNFYALRPSNVTFTELLETVRQQETTVFSLYLDTEKLYSGRLANAKSYRQARQGLKFLAEESGGLFYRAQQLEDLSGLYKKIINDLSEVYSLGYEPKNGIRDGSWRKLTVKIKDRPDLTVRSKNGYYAK